MRLVCSMASTEHPMACCAPCSARVTSRCTLRSMSNSLWAHSKASTTLCQVYWTQHTRRGKRHQLSLAGQAGVLSTDLVFCLGLALLTAYFVGFGRMDR